MTQRSKDAPMDWQYTSRPNVKPVWSQSNEEPHTPRKRNHDDVNEMNGSVPTFGTNQNIPFMFNTPAPASPQPQGYWTPPPHFSPLKAFPIVPAPDTKDVEMTDASPPKPEEPKRAVAAGALQRVYKSRQKKKLVQEVDGDASDDEDEDDVHQRAITQKTSNHYTLNMPSPNGPNSDLPYILLGYLQFFFNLSLILVFLYLVLQFILTVQRDVEERISEYSMDIVQDIAACAVNYRENNCDTPIPGVAQSCKRWKSCMNRDPTIVGRARVGAELIAEVVNGFVEPISWKTLAFTLTSLSFLTLFINALISLYRSRLHHPPAHLPPAGVPYPPHHYGGYLTPVPTPQWTRAWHENEDAQTPSRRRRLEGGSVAKIK